jgi:hypothetical protein
VDDDGYVWLGNSVGGVFKSSLTTHVSVEEPNLPTTIPIALESYPNPSTGVVGIEVMVGTPVEMCLSAFDLLGREIDVIRSGPQSAGRHTFLWEPHGLAPGVYLIRLQVNDTVITDMVTLLR